MNATEPSVEQFSPKITRHQFMFDNTKYEILLKSGD